MAYGECLLPASPSGHDGIGSIEVEVIDFLASGTNPSMSMVRLLSIAIASSSSGSICRYSPLALWRLVALMLPASSASSPLLASTFRYLIR